MSVEHCLVCLSLPGNAEAEVETIRGEIFARFGLVSARALSPVIPLYWSRIPEQTELPHKSPLRLSRPLEVGEPSVCGSLIGLTIVPEEAVNALRRSVAEYVPAEPAGLFSPHVCILLAFIEDERVGTHGPRGSKAVAESTEPESETEAGSETGSSSKSTSETAPRPAPESAGAVSGLPGTEPILPGKADIEGTESIKDIRGIRGIRGIENIRGTTLRSIKVSFLRVVARATPWWNEVHWTELASLPVRKPEKTAD